MAVPSTGPTSMRKAALMYTGGRVGLFVICAVIIWGGSGLLGEPINGLTLLLLGFLLSTLLSFVLLKEQRDRFALAISDGREAKAAELKARRSRLDAPDA